MLAGGRVMMIIAEWESGAITQPGERSGQWSVVCGQKGRRLEIGEWRLRLGIGDWMLAIGDWDRILCAASILVSRLRLFASLTTATDH